MTDSIKFLLVDDVPENLVALEALLRRDGLEILKANSGAEALELLLVHEVALAFVDVQMPEMDGFELAELMRGTEQTKHVPIIFVTAGTRDPKRMFKGYEAGAVDFLFKPIEPHVLQSKADVFFELFRQRKELADALRVNEMFVGILGHDLRNPLGAMLSGAQLMERDATDDQKRALRRMTAAGQRMTDMIEQMLDLTRARLAGGLGFIRSLQRVDVGELVRRAVEELRVVHPNREIRVEIHGDCTGSADPERLLQLFSNLISNAVIHGAADAPAAVVVQGTEREISVQVINKGTITPEILPTIFDPFRGRQSVTSRSRGLGLGLFISQQIAIAHGGSVSVESGETSGTSFTVALRRRAALAAQSPASGAAKRALIADGDEGVRSLLREAFQAQGYEVATAASGAEALSGLRVPGPADLVILETVLPIPDGRRVYQALQEDPTLAKTTVIVTSVSPEYSRPGLIVVPKPLKLDALLDAVAEL